jgi:hypothetical protein
LVFAQLMLKKFFGEFITESYADIPVAFMATASVYCLIRAEKISDRARVEKILWLGSILSAGCAVTKQTGLYLMAIYPLLSLLILKNHTEMTLREKIKLIGLQFAVAVLIVAPWYIYKEIAIWQGFDENEIVALTNIPQQQRWIDRLIPSMLALGKYISLYLLIFVMGIFSNRFYKALIYGVIIPFTLIWALMFSYDTRNVALVVPLVCICSGVSLELMYQKGMLFFSRIKVGRIPTLMVIAVVFGGLLGGALLLVSNGQLIGHQVELQKKIFATSLDDKIYQYLDTNPGNFKVISQYPVNSLPGLENSMTPFPFGDYGVFQALVNNPEYNYILLPGSANPQIQEYVDQQLSAKKYALIFEDQNNYGQYSLIKIR